MQTTLNLGLKSSLLAATVVSGAVITTSSYLFGEYQYFNTVSQKINNYVSSAVDLLSQKTAEGFNSLTNKSVDWVTKISSTAKDYAVSLVTKAGNSDTWEKGTKKLFESTTETLKQQLNTDSVFSYLNDNVFNKNKILSTISDIHGKIIPNFSKVLSSLFSLVKSLSTRALSPALVPGLWEHISEGKSVTDALKSKVMSLVQQLKEITNNDSIKAQLKQKAQEFLENLGDDAKKVINTIINSLS